MDVAIPLAFPDYLIAVETPQAVVAVPDLLPFIDVLPARIIIKEQKAKLPYLGHAGVLFFNGRSGVTKYFEYGRYDKAAKGLVRRVRIPNLTPGDRTTLAGVLRAISHKSGQDGSLTAAYIELADGAFAKMIAYAEKRERENHDPKRAPYDIVNHSCLHFAVGVCRAGGAVLQPVIDPRPTGHMALIRLRHRKLDFTPPDNLEVEST